MNNIAVRALTIGIAATAVTMVVGIGVIYLSDGFRMRFHQVVYTAYCAGLAGLVGTLIGPMAYWSISKSKSWLSAFVSGLVYALLIFAIVVFIAALNNREPGDHAGKFVVYFSLAFISVGWLTTLFGGAAAVLIYAMGGHGARQAVPADGARPSLARRG